MRGEQRQALYNLLQEADLSLCHMCKFAEWTGSPCDHCDVECFHKIDKIAENAWNVWQGDDCWAFRPWLPLDEITDIVGVLLQYSNNVGYVLDRTDKEPWRVFVALREVKP